MPIFQDDLDGRQPSSPPRNNTPASTITSEPMTRQDSEDSIRTELCEGPVLDDVIVPPTTIVRQSAINEQSPQDVSNRAELIERLKRGESPTWAPNSPFSNIFQQLEDRTVHRRTSPTSPSSSLLLPSPELKEGSKVKVSTEGGNLAAGLEIERPRSALHSGDFTQETVSRGSFVPADTIDSSPLYDPEQQSWFATSPPRDFNPFQRDSRFSSGLEPNLGQRNRSRAPSISSSLSTSFAFRAPTSPLVHSESNDELEYAARRIPVGIATSPTNNPRRYTYQASDSVHSTPSLPSSPNFNGPYPALKRDNTFPYQAHQPRRSLNLSQSQSFSSSPRTPAGPRHRRPSFNSESSPLQLTSMVGSYEESILRGRMSTAPSKPLNFVAQIGVLGLGNCKPNLRCPTHVTLAFPAVFYSYGTTTHGRSGKTEDGPSPYVGQIDLESGLSNPDEAKEEKRRKRKTSERKDAQDLDMVDVSHGSETIDRETRRAQKQKRRSTSPRAPPGGSYRIPEKGQLQIIIKNPNKTAVKLFLVPYDLIGMEPGTKTFIRQRSYSAGPVIDLPGASAPPSDPLLDRPTLRYLVHLHICSPSRGRFYLYKTIRVVFANRVPDGKEKLRNEVQLPEPRFSVYKPLRESSIGTNHSSAIGASLAADKAYRRRSSGFPLSSDHPSIFQNSNRTNSPNQLPQYQSPGISAPFPHTRQNFSTTPIESIPFNLFHVDVANHFDETTLGSQLTSPTSSKSSRPPTAQDSGMGQSWTSGSTAGVGNGFGPDQYDKLNKGDVGYGGNAFIHGSNGHGVAPVEGLLALKLKGLGVAKLETELGRDDRADIS